MAECHHCKIAIRGESGIMCAGVCKKVFHCAKRCSGVDQYSIGILDSGGYIRFICDDCLQYIHNVDLALAEIQSSVIKNKENLLTYKGEFETALKQNECEIKQLLQAIERRYEERLKKIDEAQKYCDKNIKEVKKLYITINEHENKNKEMCDTIEVNNKMMCDEIKKVITEKNVKATSKLSFADTLKNKTVMPDKNKQNPLIIKPKVKQGIDKTKEDLNRKVNPTNLKIVNVEERKNGAVVIQSESNEEREKIKEAVQNEMSGKYEIKVPNQPEMKIAVTGMSFKFSENEIIDKLRKQNDILRNSELKVLKLFEYKRNGRTFYNAKIKIDNGSYMQIMTVQKVNIGWEKCKIYDGTDIIQCFKCRGYNHKSTECKNQEICYKCHGEHKSKECNREVINKCINCVRINKRLNLGLDENHVTASRECPVYQNKLNAKKRRIGLTV